jgi:hypothetical protein
MNIELSDRDLRVLDMLFRVWDEDHRTYGDTSYSDFISLSQRLGLGTLPGLENMLAYYASLKK